MARSDIENLRDELQKWLDNMPENLQSSAKAEELETAIADLEQLLETLEEAEATEISFPRMY